MEGNLVNGDPTSVIHAYLDGELSGEQQRRLGGWLREEPANLVRFVTECQLHSELFDIHCRPAEKVLVDSAFG